jgi:hypothetical protein
MAAARAIAGAGGPWLVGVCCGWGGVVCLALARTFTVDTTKPTVTLTTPADGASFSAGQSVT